MTDTLYHRIFGTLRGSLAMAWLLWIAVYAWPVVLLAKISTKVGSILYLVLFWTFVKIIGGYFEYYYSSLFEELHQLRQQKGQPLTIVEIGPGPGINLAYFPSDTNLIIIEGRNEFKKIIEEKMKKSYPKMKLVKAIIKDVTTLTSEDIADASADIIVGTHILCCIQNDLATGQQIKRILKPGGKYFSLEIVQRDPNSQGLLEKIQRTLYRPFFRFVALGCRNGTQLPQSIFLGELGFDVSGLKTVDCPCLPTFFSTTTYGVAVNS